MEGGCLEKSYFAFLLGKVSYDWFFLESDRSGPEAIKRMFGPSQPRKNTPEAQNGPRGLRHDTRLGWVVHYRARIVHGWLPQWKKLRVYMLGSGGWIRIVSETKFGRTSLCHPTRIPSLVSRSTNLNGCCNPWFFPPNTISTGGDKMVFLHLDSYSDTCCSSCKSFRRHSRGGNCVHQITEIRFCP